MDIIERLEDEELYIDAIDDAISVIEDLREALGKIKSKSEEWQEVHKSNPPWWNLGDIAAASLKRTGAA